MKVPSLPSSFADIPEKAFSYAVSNKLLQPTYLPSTSCVWDLSVCLRSPDFFLLFMVISCQLVACSTIGPKVDFFLKFFFLKTEFLCLASGAYPGSHAVVPD